MGLSADQFLYGEDENGIVISTIPDFYLEVGKEYVLGLYYFENGYLGVEEDGYRVLYSQQGCFVRNDEGVFVNEGALQPFTVDLEQLAADCAA